MKWYLFIIILLITSKQIPAPEYSSQDIEVGFQNIQILDFTPNLNYLDEGKTISDINFELSVNSQNNSTNELEYIRGDNNHIEITTYYKLNNNYLINLQKYKFNSSIFMWPFNNYYGQINFTNLNLEDKNETISQEINGYNTKYFIKNDTLYFSVEPSTTTILDRIIWPILPLLFSIILIYYFLVNWEYKEIITTILGINSPIISYQIAKESQLLLPIPLENWGIYWGFLLFLLINIIFVYIILNNYKNEKLRNVR